MQTKEYAGLMGKIRNILRFIQPVFDAALAMSEMKGKLTALSEVKGKGAKFIMNVPVDSK